MDKTESKTRVDLLQGELRGLNAQLIDTREELARLRQVEEHLIRCQRRVAHELQYLRAQKTKASLDAGIEFRTG